MCSINSACNSTDNSTTACCYAAVAQALDACRDCSSNTSNISATIIIVLAVVGSIVALGLAALVYRMVRKPVTRAEMRKLYSIDVDHDAFIGDDLERSLIDPDASDMKSYVIANVSTNDITGSVIYLKKSCNEYDSFGEDT